jgi:hypothetical protein
MSGFLALIHAVSVGYFAARAAFGIVLFSRPGPGAATLALLSSLIREIRTAVEGEAGDVAYTLSWSLTVALAGGAPATAVRAAAAVRRRGGTAGRAPCDRAGSSGAGRGCGG